MRASTASKSGLSGGDLKSMQLWLGGRDGRLDLPHLPAMLTFLFSSVEKMDVEGVDRRFAESIRKKTAL